MTLADPPRPRARRGVPALRLSPGARRATLAAHIVLSVGLLGEVSAFLAIAARAAGTRDASLAAAAYDLLAMFQILFGSRSASSRSSPGSAAGWARSGASCATRG